jgi:hypothetical protein
MYPILLAALGSGVHSASNRNVYQKQKNNVSVEQSAAGAKGSQPYHHLCADCLDNVGSLASPTYRPPRPVTGIALLYGDGVCFL